MDKRIPLLIAVVILIALIAILLFKVDTPSPPERYYCTSALDCVAATCCHAAEAVNSFYTPDCAAVLCSDSCEGPLDCGRGHIACLGNRCTIVPNP